MARVILSTAWKEQEEAKILGFKKGVSLKYEVMLTEAIAKKWVVARMVRYEIPFSILNFGAGVVKITTDTTCCPKCKGTGSV